jgi:hypothetical protein
VTICPCCGFKFHGALANGCEQCGARAVGIALPTPSQQLPSYGRSLILAVAGSLTVLVFLVQTLIALFTRFESLGFWSWVGAAQTASWRLKWIAIPVTFMTLWLGRKLYRSIKQQPERFCGLKYARRGLLASTTVSLLVAVLIGVTIPARLEKRRTAIDAATQVNVLTIAKAMFEYRLIHKTLPDRSRWREELATLPDPDGSIADALREIESAEYQPLAEVAAVSAQKPTLRGAAIRRASISSATDDSTPAGLAFTQYDLRLPGEDKILGNEDDWIDRDGVVMKLADVAKGGIGKTAGSLRP